MPIYVFECVRCGKRGEVLGKMTDPDEGVFYCTRCETFVLAKKVPSICSFHLKGNGRVGWSSTGYASRLTPENDPNPLPPEPTIQTSFEPLTPQTKD